MQIVDYNSRELPYLHDGVFNGFQYEEEEHNILIRIKLYHNNTAFLLEFNQVFGFEMQCCDEWGYSPNIYIWTLETAKDNSLTQKLINQITDESIKEKLRYAVETEISFISGNTLRILCKQIKVTTVNS